MMKKTLLPLTAIAAAFASANIYPESEAACRSRCEQALRSCVASCTGSELDKGCQRCTSAYDSCLRYQCNLKPR